MECAKCGYDSEKNRKRGDKILCDVCRRLAPDDDSSFEKYVGEKIDKESLEPFRKYLQNEGKRKKTMVKMATKGNLMSRAPFGYRTEEKSSSLQRTIRKSLRSLRNSSMKRQA